MGTYGILITVLITMNTNLNNGRRVGRIEAEGSSIVFISRENSLTKNGVPNNTRVAKIADHLILNIGNLVTISIVGRDDGTPGR
jgi:hypothetical protein